LRTCPHRCEVMHSNCNFTTSREEDEDMFFEEMVGATEGGLDVMAAMAAATNLDSDSD